MKMKTHQAIAKKIKVTGKKRRKNYLTKHAGQDHFNARESGNATRHKRKNMVVAKADYQNVKNALPYS